MKFVVAIFVPDTEHGAIFVPDRLPSVISCFSTVSRYSVVEIIRVSAGQQVGLTQQMAMRKINRSCKAPRPHLQTSALNCCHRGTWFPL